MNLYAAYFVPNGRDPYGLWEWNEAGAFAGEFFDPWDYWKDWTSGAMGTALAGEGIGAGDAVFGGAMDAVDWAAGTDYGQGFDALSDTALDYMAGGDPRYQALGNQGALVGWAGAEAAMLLGGAAEIQAGLAALGGAGGLLVAGSGEAALGLALSGEAAAQMALGGAMMAGAGSGALNGPPEGAGDPSSGPNSSKGTCKNADPSAGPAKPTTQSGGAQTPLKTGKVKAPEKGAPNSIYEQVDDAGNVESRTFYDENGHPFARQDFGHPHAGVQPHEHLMKFDSQGNPIKVKQVQPLPPGYHNSPTSP